MIRRGITSVALAGLMAVAVGVPVVLADTVPVFTYEVHFAEGYYVKGPLVVDVVAQFGQNDGFSFHELHVGLVTTKNVRCDGHGKKRGQIVTHAEGSSDSASLKFARDLKSVKASGRIQVTEYIDNSCEGTEVQGRTYAVDVSMDLHSTGRLTSTTTVDVVTEPEGVYTDTLTTDQRPAKGTMRIDRESYPANDTSIVHQVDIVELTTP